MLVLYDAAILLSAVIFFVVLASGALVVTDHWHKSRTPAPFDPLERATRVWEMERELGMECAPIFGLTPPVEKPQVSSALLDCAALEQARLAARCPICALSMDEPPHTLPLHLVAYDYLAEQTALAAAAYFVPPHYVR